MDLQAQDRVHRIGQTKPCLIFRLSTAGTVEGRMLERAANKRKLERLVIHRRKFKGRAQLLLAEDDKLLAEELQQILKGDQPEVSEGVNPSRRRPELSAKELEMILDRSDKAYETAKGLVNARSIRLV